MAKIRIVGDSSGYVELAAPNAAGNNTLELPSNATKLVGADASNNLNVTGVATFSSGIVVSTGTTTAPSISPSGDSNTGIFFPSADTVCIGEGGTEVLRVDSSGRVGVGTNRVTRPFEVWAGTAGTSFSVDSSGRVQSPFQPAFYGVRTATGSWENPGTTAVVQIMNTAVTNVGGHYNTSTGFFTCPVAGNYRCTVAGLMGNGFYAYQTIYKNSASLPGNMTSHVAGFGAGVYCTTSYTAIVNCAVNDTLSVFHFTGGASIYGSTHSSLTIEFLG